MLLWFSDKLFPDYYVGLVASFDSNVDNDNCTDVYAKGIKEEIEDILKDPCGKLSFNYKVNATVTVTNSASQGYTQVCIMH